MIYVIGIGSGGRDSLGKRALELISGSGLLSGGERHLGLFPDFTGETAVIKGGLDRLASLIEGHMMQGAKRRVSVLATGDPLLFGIAGFLIKRFGKKKVKVIPNVSVVQEALAMINETANGLKVLSAHGRGEEITGLCEEILSSGKAAVFTDSVNTPARIASALKNAGGRGYKAHVIESIGLKGERVVSGTLEKISLMKRFAPLNVLVLIKEGEPQTARYHSPGLPDEMFVHGSGMITKAEYRAVSLSRLSIGRSSVVWDIGAGCGSVTVEAALLCPFGRVWAIEKDKKRIGDIQKNIRSFGLDNIEVVSGVAPDCLRGQRLPSPDAVFIGGGGRGIGEILAFCASRIKKGARVVVNAVTMETANTAFEFFRSRGWEKDLVLMNAARARDLNGLTMLGALNPVFIVTGKRPEK